MMRPRISYSELVDRHREMNARWEKSLLSHYSPRALREAAQRHRDAYTTIAELGLTPELARELYCSSTMVGNKRVVPCHALAQVGIAPEDWDALGIARTADKKSFLLDAQHPRDSNMIETLRILAISHDELKKMSVSTR